MIFKFIVSLLFLNSAFAQKQINISKNVFKLTPFSEQYASDGAVIRSIYYPAVKSLIPQLESIYNIELQDRGEAHITILTPPEGNGSNGVLRFISYLEIKSHYENVLQKMPFAIKCIGARKDQNRNIVFYLVVDSPALFQMRREIQREASKRALESGEILTFNPFNFYPHITIGFYGSDIHGVSKGTDTCLNDLHIKYLN